MNEIDLMAWYGEVEKWDQHFAELWTRIDINNEPATLDTLATALNAQMQQMALKFELVSRISRMQAHQEAERRRKLHESLSNNGKRYRPE